MELKIKLLDPRAKLPEYMTPGAAAMDLYAVCDGGTALMPGERKLISTGLALQFPEGYAAVVCARSGLASKYGVSLSNGIGVIDSDYTGELKVALANLSSEPFTVEPGMRIAQLMIIPVCRADIKVVPELDGTERGAGGFGSTGKM